MKTLIVMSAVAGAGKSSWSHKFKDEHKNVQIVSSDEIRKEVFGYAQNLDHEDEVWERYYSDILKYRDMSDDVTVIADSTHISNLVRMRTFNNSPGFDKYILVMLIKDLETIKMQNNSREPGRVVPEDVVVNMWNHFEEPSDEVKEKFNEIIRVDN